MAKETEAILRSLLMHAYLADDLTQMQHIIKSLCSKDDVASVMAELAEMGKLSNKDKGAS